MTADEAFNVTMNMYPSLYNASSLLDARFKYDDQIFNTVGNGYRDMKEFKDGHTVTAKNIHLTMSFPEKYITGEPLFYAYTEVEEKYGYKTGKESSCLEGVYSEKELKLMPEVVHTMQSNKKYKYDKGFNPYPNFQKEYSLVWDNISSLDKSWPEAALVFYKKCQEYFVSDKVSNYHYACPNEGDEAKWEKSIKVFEENFARYKTEGMSQDEHYQKISKEYEVEYTGDTKDFIKRRWTKELKRINEFLDETIDRLENMLIPKITSKGKKKII